jgi:hypothetical protein
MNMTTKSKSSNWNKAAARAKGETETTEIVTTDGPTSLDEIGQAEAFAMVRPANAASIAARIAAGEIEAAEKLFKLDEGMEITGRLYGSGQTQLPNMQNPAVLDTVATYQIEMFHPETGARGPKISILGGAQLDRDLPPRIGKDVVIAVGGMIKTTKGKQMREFFVGTIKRPTLAGDGQ